MVTRAASRDFDHRRPASARRPAPGAVCPVTRYKRGVGSLHFVRAEVENELRRLAPQVLGVLIRRYGQFDACEDAVQEALLAAAVQWPAEGVPDNPRGWLITVAARRLMDQFRSDDARRRREIAVHVSHETSDIVDIPDKDDTLLLLFLCCHPSLSSASQLALTLRAVGGLTTAQIAHAFLVPESTLAQRVSRAKQKIKSAGASFSLPPPAERAGRLQVVLQVLYLIFNEGYTASSGEELHRPELTVEATRLAREVHRLVDDGEVAGLLALMLLTDARRPARTRPDGTLVPLADQDRTLWNPSMIAEGVDLITRTLPTGPPGSYQLQAAIAAIHCEAASAEDTDWPQILALYQLLERVAPNPMVTLNQAVAVAMVQGPAAGLRVLEALDADERLARHHRLAAVRAHLLEMSGDVAAARAAYELAARRTTSIPEQRYLLSKAALLHR
ncbi:RNA polymerase sigma24 factor [Dactylosporangium siamense]|uniref:RNA polymerase sigma24 factor n=1 Tax=Dactylosporangium siamense TaxID=685454 RepID=A0A919UDJ5_9ACTN|nr:RNA polymerase sigma24 factor [Dactylosporangium siamense]